MNFKLTSFSFFKWAQLKRPALMKICVAFLYERIISRMNFYVFRASLIMIQLSLEYSIFQLSVFIPLTIFLHFCIVCLWWIFSISGLIPWTGLAQWLRYCATNLTVSRSILGGVSHCGFFPQLPMEPCALRSTQPIKMTTRDFSGGKGGQCLRLATYHPRSAER